MDKDLENILNILRESKKTHFTIAENMLKAYENSIYPLDLLAVAVFKRSLSLIRGFIQLIESENFICAVPLMRLQIDNLLRFYAAFIVEKPHDFAMDIFNGKHVRNLKDQDGNKMTDRYLLDKLSQEFEWLNRIYEKTSGYVHLSNEHIFDAIKAKEIDCEQEFSILITDKDDEIRVETKIDATRTMCEITKVLLKYLHGWSWTKDNPEKVRQQRRPSR